MRCDTCAKLPVCPTPGADDEEFKCPEYEENDKTKTEKRWAKLKIPE